MNLKIVVLGYSSHHEFCHILRHLPVDVRIDAESLLDLSLTFSDSYASGVMQITTAINEESSVSFPIITRSVSVADCSILRKYTLIYSFHDNQITPQSHNLKNVITRPTKITYCHS